MTTRRILIRLVDGSLVAASLGLILFTVVALRPSAERANGPAGPASTSMTAAR
ncbi:hypothetical protein [Phreatobacter sp.]|uniref:hypothetical protein n=1 Tax=Phreatobacter sp. TaxID=1966341 RepID=UPI0025EC8181|nr:hypothetical protein [Phreatobacter sp.]